MEGIVLPGQQCIESEQNMEGADLYYSNSAMRIVYIVNGEMEQTTESHSENVFQKTI